MILPAFGIVSHIISTFSTKPVFGYLGVAYAMVAAVLTRILVYPMGVLATTPLDYRLVCLGLGLALMFFSKKLWLALIGSMGAFAILVTYF